MHGGGKSALQAQWVSSWCGVTVAQRYTMVATQLGAPLGAYDGVP